MDLELQSNNSQTNGNKTQVRRPGPASKTSRPKECLYCETTCATVEFLARHVLLRHYFVIQNNDQRNEWRAKAGEGFEDYFQDQCEYCNEFRDGSDQLIAQHVLKKHYTEIKEENEREAYRQLAGKAFQVQTQTSATGRPVRNVGRPRLIDSDPEYLSDRPVRRKKTNSRFKVDDEGPINGSLMASNGQEFIERNPALTDKLVTYGRRSAAEKAINNMKEQIKVFSQSSTSNDTSKIDLDDFWLDHSVLTDAIDPSIPMEKVADKKMVKLTPRQLKEYGINIDDFKLQTIKKAGDENKTYYVLVKKRKKPGRPTNDSKKLPLYKLKPKKKRVRKYPRKYYPPKPRDPTIPDRRKFREDIPRPPGVKDSCKKCKQEFEDDFLLCHHLRKHFEEEVLPTMEPLTRAKRPNKPFGERNYVCDICGQSYLYPHSLSHHRKTEHDEDTYINDELVPIKDPNIRSRYSEKVVCEHCGKEISTAQMYRHQVNVHFPQYKPYRCDSCDEGIFMTAVKLMWHRRQHHMPEAPPIFVCETCGKGFNEPKRFQWHRDRHEGKKHKCKHCDFECASKDNIRQHVIRVHEQNMKFQCVSHCKVY